MATAAPPTPAPILADVEEVGQMCQQLRQCVGTCDMQSPVGVSGTEAASETQSVESSVQVCQTCAVVVCSKRDFDHST